MSAPRFVSPLFFWLDSSGAPLAAGTLQFYAGDSATQAAVYADSALTTPLVQPILANGAGQWPAIFLNPSVVYKAILLDQTGAQIWSQYPISASGVFYPVAFEFLGGTPAFSSEVMGMHTFLEAVAFPPNFQGSAGYCLVNPTAPFVATVGDQNGKAIGAISINAAGLFTFNTTNSAGFTAQPGDTWIVKAPAVADATLANLAFTLSGVLAQ